MFVGSVETLRGYSVKVPVLVFRLLTEYHTLIYIYIYIHTSITLMLCVRGFGNWALHRPIYDDVNVRYITESSILLIS